MKKGKKPDFAGWVTKNDIRCSDGVIIKEDAFQHNDGQFVPLVYNHNHKDITAVVGKILLKNKPGGVYGYGYFNNSPNAEVAKDILQHGDISHMSIAANHVKRQAGNVIHGNIWEVSLVLSAANPGARIAEVKHSDETGENFILYTDCVLHSTEYLDDDDEIIHGSVDPDDEKEVDKEESETKNEAEKLGKQVAESLTDKELSEIVQMCRDLVGGEVSDEKLLESMTEEDFSKVTEKIMQQLGSTKEEPEDEEGKEDVEHMQTNLFENQDEMTVRDAMKNHAQLMDDVLETAKAIGSLRDAMIQHGVDATIQEFRMGYIHHEDAIMHGVTDSGNAIDTLQHSSITTIESLWTKEPINMTPTNIYPEEDDVIDAILGGCTKTPKHTVMSRHADLTTPEARALGYIKGDEKIEDHWGTIERQTHPTTIYKYQTVHNDDLIDIDWNVIDYMTFTGKKLWRYEAARAIIIGDGRPVGNRQKINEKCIIPIIKEDPFFKTDVGGVNASNFIEKVITHMAVDYKGTGTPIMLSDKTLIAAVRLQKGTDGHYLLPGGIMSKSTLADICGVKRILEPDFLIGTGLTIIVNLADYEMATPDRGKQKSYSDFNLKFNEHEFLTEGRFAGALVQARSALVLKSDTVTNSKYTEAEGVTAENFGSGVYYTRFVNVYDLATEYKPHTTYYTKVA